ncbi:helix-turn-helix transcriptional regulator [Kribbella sp. DT2]|uniref:helix-turn-helix transcriptional regulator n=1 Tax=Kribbella sp. DT2 TaxID=3393427 RepID=UPI003CF9A77C
MRAERLLRLLLHLQTRGQSTVAQLAQQLEVSPRTVQRDLDALSLAGVPVYSVRGRGGGWALLPDYRTRLTGLTPSEVMSVFVGATAHVLADLGVGASSDQAIDKLIAALPAPARRDAEFARQRLLIDHAGWYDDHETPRWLDVCREAIWEEQLIAITYRHPGEPFAVAPLGLVAKNRTWYLVAVRGPAGAGVDSSASASETGRRRELRVAPVVSAGGGSRSSGGPQADLDRFRTYRLSRIGSAVLTGISFTRPSGFELAAYWAEAQVRFGESRSSYPMVLRVRGNAVRRFRATAPAEDGWSVVEADLENANEACAAVLAQGGDAVVVAPEELAVMVRLAASKVLGAHS